MQTATTAYGIIVSSSEATVAVRVTITWPAGVPTSYQTLSETTVVSCRPTRQTLSDMPDNTRYVQGVAASDCDIVLSGLLDPTDDTKTIAWLMGQYQTTSPLYRQDALGLPVTVDMGVFTGDPALATPPFNGTEFLRVLTGVIDDYTVDMQAGTVSITCLDKRSMLTTAPQLPAGVVDYNPYSAGLIQPGLTGQYPMAALLRNGGLYTTPAPRPNLVYFQSMQGSVWPENVSGGTVTQASWAFTRQFSDYVWSVGRFSQQVPASSMTNVTGTATVSLATGGTVFAEWFAKSYTITGLGTGLTITAGSGNSLFMTSQGNATMVPKVTLTRGGTPTTVTSVLTNTVSVFRYWGFAVSFPTSTQMTVTFYVDGATDSQTVTVPASPATDPANQITQVGAACEGIQVTTEANPASWGINNGFTPTATLDPSLNNLTALPDVTGNDAWQTLQDLAEAEQGVSGLNELGLFAFKNRRSIQTGASVRTITASSLAQVTAMTAQAQLINHVQISVNKLQVGKPGWVWSAPDTITVPRGGTYTQVVDCGNPVIALATTDSGVCPSGQTPDGKTYFRACQQPSGAGLEVKTGIAVTASQIAPTQIKITVTNSNAFPVYLVTPIGVGYPSSSNGNPCLLIGGQFVTTTAQAGDSTAATATSSGVLADSQWPPLVPDGGATKNPRGEKLLNLGDNLWRQQVVATQAFSDDLLADLTSRRPEWSIKLAIPDGRLQRGDRITLSDPEVTGMAAEDALIFEISIDDDWTQTLGVRALAAPGGWILGQAGRSELGATSTTSTIWIE